MPQCYNDHDKKVVEYLSLSWALMIKGTLDSWWILISSEESESSFPNFIMCQKEIEETRQMTRYL